MDSFVCRDIRQMSDTETTLERLNNKLVVLSPLYHLRQRVYVFARSVCLFVGLLVGEQDYTETTERIFMKLSPRIDPVYFWCGFTQVGKFSS